MTDSPDTAGALATPLDVLEFWIGPARDEPDELAARHRIWFGKSPEVDREIAARFLETLGALAGGLDEVWAARGPRARLAAIIVLDQFSRNVFRDTPHAFEHDARARALTHDGLADEADRALSEVERAFFYMPLEHSESAEDQALSVALYQRLAEQARPAFRDFAESTLSYARRHKAVIDTFGRFPHRNSLLGRPSTREENTYLAQPGAGF